MKKLLLLVVSLVIALPIFAGEGACPASWGYESSNGPDRWAQMETAWAACDGKTQSPVDLGKAQKADLPLLTPGFNDAPLILQNTGHDLKVPVGNGTVRFGTREARLQQFHFHVKSEHTMNGAQSDAEIHIVSETADKKLIVIGVFIDEGPENEALKTLLALRPDTDCTSRKALTPNFNAMRLLPQSTKSFFSYGGSLTTPACDEIVTWIVLRDHITASRAQLDALKVHHENARPPQPLGLRVVQKNF